MAVDQVTATTPAAPSQDQRDGHAAGRVGRRRSRPSPTGMLARAGVLTLLITAVVAVPHLVDATLVPVVAKAAVYAIVALSLNILLGYAGQLSLGHAAFVGIGAFAAGKAMTALSLPWPVALLVAITVGALQASLLGIVALRIRGMYLALVTLAYGIFAEHVLFAVPQLTGGGAGQPVPRPAFASGDIPYTYLCFAALAAVWAIDWRLTSSKAGRAIQALRDDERVAASWGVNVTAYRLLAFVLSGMVAGVAGALFGSIEQIAVSVTFSFGLSLTFLLMTVIGGIRSRPGVVIGGVVFASLDTVFGVLERTVSWWPFGPLWVPLLGAALLLATLLKFPGGIAQQLSPVLRWLSFETSRPATTMAPAREMGR